MRRAVLLSCGVVAALASAGILVGYTSLSGLSGEGVWAARSATEEISASRIAVTNLAAAALLFSGAATGGVGSAVGLFLVSAYVGATWAVATGNLGWSRVLVEIGPYAVLEFGGLLLVAVGGLLPIVHAVRSLSAEGRRPLAYVDALGPAAAVAGAGVVLVVAGAVVESAVL